MLAQFYLPIKLLHVTCVALSISLFLLRGFWMMRGSPLLHSRFARIVPHVVDTLLLASAIALTVIIRQYPFVHAWLTAKVLGLVLYIALGMVALKYGRTRGVRFAAFVAAVLVFVWIVRTARLHAPWLIPV